MLLILHADEYLDALPEYGERDDFLAFVEALAAVLEAGLHALHCTPRVAQRLSQLAGLSRAQRRLFRHIGRALIIEPPAPIECVTHAVVISGPLGTSSTRPPPGTTWFRVPWHTVRTVTDLGPTVLAAENGDDAEWLRWLARAYSARARPALRAPGADVHLQCRGVGGSTAWQEVPRFVRDGHPTLCVVDSDRRHPDGPVGQTAAKLRKQLDAVWRPSEQGGSARPPLVHDHCLAARELENLMPSPVLDLIGRNTEWLEPMKARGFFVGPDRAPDPALAYLDISGKDQCRDRLLNEKADPAIVAYHTRAIARMQALSAGCPGEACDASSEGCAARKPDKGYREIPPACRFVYSVGKKVVPKAVSLLDRQPRHRAFGGDAPAAWLARQLPPPQDGESADRPMTGPVWSVARLVWSWGLRDRPRIPRAR